MGNIKIKGVEKRGFKTGFAECAKKSEILAETLG